MAAYPSLNIDLTSAREPVNLKRTAYTGAGTVRGTVTGSANLFRFNVIHRGITKADADGVWSCWTSNKTADIAFTWVADSITYTVQFEEPPEINLDPSTGTTWIAKSKLIGA